MAEQVRNLIAKWSAAWPSPLIISRQRDNGQFRINLVDYPEPENYEDQSEEVLETISYYLTVWMKQTEAGEIEKLAPIQLPGPYWRVYSPYTQLVQCIKFQFFATSSVTGYIGHSAIFTGLVLDSLEEDGEDIGVIPAEMWDAYKQYIEDKIIAAGVTTIDPTLSIQGAAADAKAAGDAVAELNGRLEELEQGSTGGLTADVKVALLACFNHVVWDDDDPTGQSYINALQTALYPPANLSRITAVYTQSGTVWSTDTLDSLKNDLVVTAYYDNSTSEVITNYTLSGTLSEGTRTITVSYGNKTATFNVVVTRADNSVYNWDFTSSLVDSKQDVEAVLTGATRDSNGVTFNASTDFISLCDVSAYGTSQFTVEVEFGAFTGVGNTASWPIALGTGTTFGTVCGVRTYTSAWAFTTPANVRKYFNTVSLDAFNNKTLKFVYDLLGDNVWRVYADGVLLMEDTSPYNGLNNRKYLGIAFLPANSVVKKVRVYAGVV